MFASLDENISTYQHEIRAIGGFYSATITANYNQVQIEDWIEYGIGRHIVIHNDALEVIWEGFVNKVSAALGELAFEIGPLLDIGNRVKAVYSTVDYSVEPPVLGKRDVTAIANDTSSQAIYSIVEKVLSTGGSTPVEAEQNRDTFIAENAYPPTSLDLALGRGTQEQVTLDCLGYWHLLGAFTYTNTGVVGTEDISTKLQNILAQDPNSIFSTDYNRIRENTFQVKQYENDDKTALELVKALNSLGDTSSRRYNIGVYADQQLVYERAPTEYEYVKRIGENEDFKTPTGAIVEPWNVRSGKWFFVSDFLAGRVPPSTRNDLNRDPRAGYIESAIFTAPRDIRVDGKKLGQLDQALARQGLAGVGV